MKCFQEAYIHLDRYFLHKSISNINTLNRSFQKETKKGHTGRIYLYTSTIVYILLLGHTESDPPDTLNKADEEMVLLRGY